MEVDNENSLGNDESDRLTSTIGNINTTPTTDSVPSSSSDANSEVITTDKPCDDPISSTSDEVDKVNTSIITNANASDVKINPSPNTSKCGALESPKHGIEEADIFANEYNLGSTSEKITENVEDIVSDLENLLGDTSNDFSVDLIKKKDVSCDEKMQVEDQNESTREKSPVADQQSLSDDNMSRNTEVISDQKPEPTLDASPKETKDETPTVEASVDVVENEDSELSNPKITKEVLLQEDKKEVDIQAHVALIENSEKSQPTQVENEDIVPLEASQIEKCAVGAKLNETEVVGNKHNIAANESDNQEIKSPGEDNLSEATKCEEMEITPTLETAIIEPSFSQPQSEPKTGAEEKHILVEEKQMVAQEPCNIAEVQEIVVGESEKDKVNPQIIAKEPEIETDEICNVAEKQETSEKESEMLSVEEKAETNEPEIIAEVSQADEHTSESQLQNESVKESFEAVKVSEHVLQEAQQAAEESQTLADRKSEPMDEPSDVTEEPMEIDDEVAPKSSKPVTTIYESHEDPPLVDHEAELVKAALEASSASNEGNDDSKQDENTNNLI